MATTTISENFEQDAISATHADWPGGKGILLAEGTWGGGTLTLEVSIDGGSNYFTVGADTTLTADGGGSFDLPVMGYSSNIVKVRLNLSGATSPNINVVVSRSADRVLIT